MVQNMLRILVNTYAGTVQHLNDLTVNASRCNTQLAPYCLTFGRSPADINQLAFLFAAFAECLQGNIFGYIIRSSSIYGPAQIGGYPSQLSLILHAVVRRLAFGRCQQRQSHAPSVVGVCSSTTGNAASQVSGRNS